MHRRGARCPSTEAKEDSTLALRRALGTRTCREWCRRRRDAYAIKAWRPSLTRADELRRRRTAARPSIYFFT